MSKVRVCFLGTPEFALTSLKALLSDDHYEIVGVVTQPDRPAGRKMQLTPSPVKIHAQAQGLKVLSPESVNKDFILEEIQKWGAEIAVVVAFGQILSTKFLNLFPFGAVNVHGSILPRWRGAAPIQRALEAGDEETGVTLQKVVKELDAGDLLGIRKMKIPNDMDAWQLHDQLALLGCDLLHIELMDYMRGNLAPVPQDPAGVTYAKKIEKSEAEIKWSLPAEGIHNKVRAFHMGPGTFTTLNGKKLKIHQTKVTIGSGQPGAVLEASDRALIVATGQGALEILVIQPESRNKIGISEFLKGNPLKKGDHLGS
ncbi:MAG: methionyl-tRNA formyltransferase [Pseudobdellovibrionaceae bacterium]